MVFIACRSPLGVVFLRVVAFVVGLAAAGKPYDDLQPALVEKHTQAHDRKTLVLSGAEFVQLAAVEQQLAARRGVVAAGTPRVLGDIDAANPKLAAVEIAMNRS